MDWDSSSSSEDLNYYYYESYTDESTFVPRCDFCYFHEAEYVCTICEANMCYRSRIMCKFCAYVPHLCKDCGNECTYCGAYLDCPNCKDEIVSDGQCIPCMEDKLKFYSSKPNFSFPSMIQHREIMGTDFMHMAYLKHRNYKEQIAYDVRIKEELKRRQKEQEQKRLQDRRNYVNERKQSYPPTCKRIKRDCGPYPFYSSRSVTDYGHIIVLFFLL